MEVGRMKNMQQKMKDEAEAPMGMPMKMSMTFSWGKNSGSFKTYVIELIVLFLVAMLVECLSHTRFTSSYKSNVKAGLVQTFMYGMRIALAYWVMLSVMSFDGGLFVAAVAGYTIGFCVFGSRVFENSDNPKGSASDLPSFTC